MLGEGSRYPARGRARWRSSGSGTEKGGCRRRRGGSAGRGPPQRRGIGRQPVAPATRPGALRHSPNQRLQGSNALSSKRYVHSYRTTLASPASPLVRHAHRTKPARGKRGSPPVDLSTSPFGQREDRPGEVAKALHFRSPAAPVDGTLGAFPRCAESCRKQSPLKPVCSIVGPAGLTNRRPRGLAGGWWQVGRRPAGAPAGSRGTPGVPALHRTRQQTLRIRPTTPPTSSELPPPSPMTSS